MLKTKMPKFQRLSERKEVQTEEVDQTVYTDQVFTTDRASLMRNLELGFPEPSVKFLNGRAMQAASLIENIEEAMITSDINAEMTISETLKNLKYIAEAEAKAKHEEKPEASGDAPKEN